MKNKLKIEMLPIDELHAYESNAKLHPQERYGDRKQTTVMDFDKPQRNGEHPTMKPVELFAYQMEMSSKSNDNVLDLFGGSGTTMIAAEQLNRNAYLMELDPRYCDVIIERWESFTGLRAELIGGSRDGSDVR